MTSEAVPLYDTHTQETDPGPNPRGAHGSNSEPRSIVRFGSARFKAKVSTDQECCGVHGSRHDWWVG